ncbi:MAG: hypothetical protein HWE30_14435 [Methylocystaceae bacterium]|nr:hypothetical protein [Methylocystaceae bacterium]
MSLITDRISLFDPQVRAIDLSQQKIKHISEGPEELYQQYIRFQEQFLEAQYTEFSNNPDHPRNQDYARIMVNGQEVASIDNNGFVTSSNAIGGRLHSLLAQENSSASGPALAEERAAKIAQLLGGTVEKSATALTPAAYQASTSAQTSVDYDALKADKRYARLQEIKEARSLFLAQNMGQNSTETGSDASASIDTIVLNTNLGTQAVDLASLFNPQPQSGPIDLMSVPLILPTADNIKALSQHGEEKFNALLSDYGIPEAPREISYDREGRLVLPDDYAYKDELTQALDENPTMARELSTIAAITSHYVGMNAISSPSGGYAKITLNFDKDGALSVRANGQDYDRPTSSETQQANKTYETASDRSDAEKWFLDYMEKTPEQRMFEAILREKGMTPEEYEALPPEQRAELEQEIQEEMKKRTLAEMGSEPGAKNEQFA